MEGLGSLFSPLFRRAEASVDNAVGEIGNRVVIAIPFLAAFGFATVSLWSVFQRLYGAELGNLVGAAALVVYGRRPSPTTAISSEDVAAEEPMTDATGLASLLNNDAAMSALSSAAPILLSAALRTGRKNWMTLLAIAAALYFIDRNVIAYVICHKRRNTREHAGKNCYESAWLGQLP